MNTQPAWGRTSPGTSTSRMLPLTGPLLTSETSARRASPAMMSRNTTSGGDATNEGACWTPAAAEARSPTEGLGDRAAAAVPLPARCGPGCGGTAAGCCWFCLTRSLCCALDAASFLLSSFVGCRRLMAFQPPLRPLLPPPPPLPASPSMASSSAPPSDEPPSLPLSWLSAANASWRPSSPALLLSSTASLWRLREGLEPAALERLLLPSNVAAASRCWLDKRGVDDRSTAPGPPSRSATCMARSSGAWPE